MKPRYSGRVVTGNSGISASVELEILNQQAEDLSLQSRPSRYIAHVKPRIARVVRLVFLKIIYVYK